MSLLVVSEPECVKSVVLSRSAPFPISPFPGKAFIILVGNAPEAPLLLGQSTVTPHVKAIRKAYAAGFQTSSLKRAWPALRRVLDELIATIERDRATGIVDVQTLFVKFALDGVGVVALGTTLGGLDGSRNIPELLIEVGHLGAESFFNPVKKAFYELFPHFSEAQKRQRTIDRLTSEYDRIAEEVLKRKAPADDYQPVWFGLRNCRDLETNTPISYESLRAEIATLIFAGMDSTGHQLGWIFAFLAAHPGVVDKILEELRDRGLYGHGARDVVFEDLGELPYLTAVIKEGMRIAHVVSATMFRLVPEDMTMMGYSVPKGTLVVVPGNRWMGTAEEWGDPHVFRPERWLTDEDMSRVHYLGFSHGPRDCVGQKLAMLEMRLVLVKLLTRYHFELTTPLEELMLNSKNGVVIESKKGVPLKITPRRVA